MRLDKYLKVSRLIKRRTIANEMASSGHVLINGKPAKPSSNVLVGDVLSLKLKVGTAVYRIVAIYEFATEEKAKLMYELIEGSNNEN